MVSANISSTGREPLPSRHGGVTPLPTHQPDDYQRIGANLRQARERLGIPQEEIARLLGVEPPTYSRYETAERKIPIPDLRRVAAHLGVTFDELVGDGPRRRPARVLLQEAMSALNDDIDLGDPDLEAMLKDVGRELTGEEREGIKAYLRHARDRKRQREGS